MEEFGFCLGERHCITEKKWSRSLWYSVVAAEFSQQYDDENFRLPMTWLLKSSGTRTLVANRRIAELYAGFNEFTG